MKVIFVATVSEHIKAFHLPYLQWFKDEGCEVHVATSGNDKLPFCDKKYNISIQRSPFNFSNIRAYFELRVILKREEYDIIHCHTPMGGVLGRLCAYAQRNRKTKIIYTAHGFHFYKGAPVKNWLLYYPLEKWLAKHTDVLITINKEDFELASQRMKAKKTYYIPGIGVDAKRFSKPCVDRMTKRIELGIPQDSTIIISIGELNKGKNHQRMIRVLSKMENTDLYYIICGRGKQKDCLIELSEKLAVRDRVILLGYRTDTADLLHMSDIFVFPSLREGLPVALMEAMAAGLPCVVSNIRGNIDLIKEGRGGFYCADKDEDYIAAIMKIMQNDSLKAGMGEYNKSAVLQFDIIPVMKQMIDLYKHV